MKRTLTSENEFVVELLQTLRNDKFSPSGWGRFLYRSWIRSYKTAAENPILRRSWTRITFWFALLTCAILFSNGLIEGLNATIRLLPGFLFCVLWQQSDLFWHLGLNRKSQSGKLLPTVGWSNIFTWLRGLAACYLLGRLSGGLATPSSIALAIFLYGIATDILDGQVARLTATQSKLGQIADGEADFCLYLAITIILIQNSVLPLWLGVVMLLRFCIPLIVAGASYFLLAHPVRFGSTLWGKSAGLAQCLYFLLLLAPPSLSILTHLLNLPLLLITLFLLIAAPCAQIVANIHTLHT